MWSRRRVRNAPTISSSPAQIRDTSDFEIPESTPKRGDQVVDRAGRHAVDVGLHHHRVERLIDPSAGLQDRREERCPCAAWGCAARCRRPGSPTAAAGSRCGQWCGCRCVRSGRRRSARSLRPRSAPASPAARRRGSDRRPRRRGTRPAGRTGQTVTGPSVWFSFVCSWSEHTENHADGPTQWWTPPATSNPTTSGDVYLRAQRRDAIRPAIRGSTTFCAAV